MKKGKSPTRTTLLLFTAQWCQTHNPECFRNQKTVPSLQKYKMFTPSILLSLT